MAIDMATLKATTFGDPDSKLTVKRSWLKEVHRLLEEAERSKRELESLKAKVKAHNDRITSQNDHDDLEDMDSVFDGTFGEGGVFEKMFGKRKGRRG